MVMINLSNKSSTLTPKFERRKAIPKKLVDGIDVLVKNIPVETMELGYDQLSEVNLELVYAHGSGFGGEGEYTEYMITNLTTQAIGGIIIINRFTDEPSVKAGIAVADSLDGIHLATGGPAALYD